MARRSLRPSLNQIRTWVRQGRTDAWIAHQLEVTVQQVQEFRRENDLLTDSEGGEPGGVDFDDEIDLRAEDDAQIAAELEAAAAAKAAAAPEPDDDAEDAGDDEADEDSEDGQAKTRRRGRRGGRTRRGRASGPLEGTFDHGEDGYGLWLDPAVQDNPIYAEHWAGHRPVEVTVEEEQIVIRRVGDD